MRFHKVEITKKTILIVGICLLLIFIVASIRFNNSRISAGYVHLSIDDSEALFEAEKLGLASIFDVPEMAYMKFLHEKYGAKITLYTYSQVEKADRIMRINDVSKKYFEQLSENADWLKIGFHWVSPNNKKDLTIKEFQNAFNNFKSTVIEKSDSALLSNILRLHYFYAPDSLVRCLNGVATLLCADSKERLSYDLSRAEADFVYNNARFTKDSLNYVRTDIRLENYFRVPVYELANRNSDTIVIFTHEWALKDESVKNVVAKLLPGKKFQLNAINKDNLKVICEWLTANNIKYVL